MPAFGAVLRLLQLSVKPSAPPSGSTNLYVKSDGYLYSEDPTGFERPVGSPIGTVVAYAGAAAPSGWLTCDGSEASRITYAALYAVLGGASSPYGQGNGTTTFNLPDLRSRTIFGAGTYGALGTGDQNIETNRNTQHQHGSGTLANSNTGLGQQTNTSDVGGSRLRLTSPDPHTHTITGTTSFQLGAANFPHLSLNFLIKT